MAIDRGRLASVRRVPANATRRVAAAPRLRHRPGRTGRRAARTRPAGSRLLERESPPGHRAWCPSAPPRRRPSWSPRPCWSGRCWSGCSWSGRRDRRSATRGTRTMRAGTRAPDRPGRRRPDRCRRGGGVAAGRDERLRGSGDGRLSARARTPRLSARPPPLHHCRHPAPLGGGAGVVETSDQHSAGCPTGNGRPEFAGRCSLHRSPSTGRPHDRGRRAQHDDRHCSRSAQSAGLTVRRTAASTESTPAVPAEPAPPQDTAPTTAADRRRDSDRANRYRHDSTNGGRFTWPWGRACASYRHARGRTDRFGPGPQRRPARRPTPADTAPATPVAAPSNPEAAAPPPRILPMP